MIKNNLLTKILIILGLAFSVSTFVSADRTANGVPGDGVLGRVLQSIGGGESIWVATSSLGLGGGGSGTVTSVSLTTPTGLTGASTTCTTNCFLNIALTAGYNIPLTASTTQWNNFYNASSTFVPFSYASSTFASTTWVVTTFPTFSYASSTYYFATNPSNYITNTVSGLTNYPTYTYASGTFSTYAYGTSTYATILNYPTYTYASSTFASTTWVVNTFAPKASPTFTGTSTFTGIASLATTTINGDLTMGGAIIPRVVAYTGSTTITINTNTTDIATTTVRDATSTFAVPSGTLFDGKMFEIWVKATTTRGLAWSTSTNGFASSTDLALPITVASGTSKFIFEYRNEAGMWELNGYVGGFIK